MRHLTFLIIGLAAGTWIGTLLDDGLFAGGHSEGSHAMGLTPYETLPETRKNYWPDEMPAPTIEMDLVPDPASGHNLIFAFENFEMTPEDVNQAVEPGTGHGHLFVNGENIGRLYGTMRHMVGLPKGEVTIHMYLGGNDHKVWIADGEPMFIEKTFMIE